MNSVTLRIVSVNVARARGVMIQGRRFMSAIDKQPVEGDVAVTPLGLAGDEQADLSVHGGLTKAVYAYAFAQLAFWTRERQLARGRDAAPDAGLDQRLFDDASLTPGAVGENLTIDGLDESQWWIGDVLELPHCKLVVSEPRFPCFKFNAVMGFNQAAKRMVQTRNCGAYLSVLKPGHVRAGDQARLLPGPREVRVADAFAARARA